jgi:hypothetical protein
MEKASTGVAWICIFSTLVMGCHGAVEIVSPDGPNHERMYSDEIIYADTKNGQRHECDPPPDLRDSVLIGYVLGEYTQISVPGVERLDAAATWVAIVACAGLVGGHYYLGTMALKNHPRLRLNGDSCIYSQAVACEESIVGDAGRC